VGRLRYLSTNVLEWLAMGRVVDLETMKQERERLRNEGKRVVFTNGCFDLLHRGHVRYLKDARGRGGGLIVAFKSERSFRALQGAGGPILEERDRAEVISALAAVDYVLIFDEENPREVIRALLPDILVKGGDWPIEQIIGRAEVEAAGGKVMSLGYVEGSST